jgi:hypothetical protein
MVNWTAVFNRMMKLIDGPAPEHLYYSGPTFIGKIQEFNPAIPDYGTYTARRNLIGASTSRRDYFKDLFLALEDDHKFQFATDVLTDAKESDPKGCEELRKVLGSRPSGPAAKIPDDAWNADRLKDCLQKMDDKIQVERDWEGAVTLAYTSLEGFFKAFVRKHIPDRKDEKEITALAKLVKDYVKARNRQYPDEVLNLLTQTAYALNKTRDGFSESHFAEESEEWIATYMRDLVNTQICLLLHFM